jgi:hypothetical protein
MPALRFVLQACFFKHLKCAPANNYVMNYTSGVTQSNKKQIKLLRRFARLPMDIEPQTMEQRLLKILNEFSLRPGHKRHKQNNGKANDKKSEN